MHGGLSPDLKNLQQIAKLSRPSEIPEEGILCDLLWSDPASSNSPYVLNVVPKKWGDNERGVSYVFGEKVVKDEMESGAAGPMLNHQDPGGQAGQGDEDTQSEAGSEVSVSQTVD